MYAAVYHFGPHWATYEYPGQKTACAEPVTVYPLAEDLDGGHFERLRAEITRREESPNDRMTFLGPMALETSNDMEASRRKTKSVNAGPTGHQPCGRS